MNAWIIVGIIAGVLLIGGLVIGNFVTADVSQKDSEVSSATTCGNSCTSQNNCGLQTCAVVNGGGSCGCQN